MHQTRKIIGKSVTYAVGILFLPCISASIWLVPLSAGRHAERILFWTLFLWSSNGQDKSNPCLLGQAGIRICSLDKAGAASLARLFLSERDTRALTKDQFWTVITLARVERASVKWLYQGVFDKNAEP